MQQKGILFSRNDKIHRETINYIRKLVVDLLLNNTKDAQITNGIPQANDEKMEVLENVYFALSEQAKEGLSLPPVLIESWIEAMSRYGQTKLAFAAIKELEVVANLPPTVNFYNALLSGIAASKDPDVLNKVIVAFQEWEDSSKSRSKSPDSQPNEESYSILFETLIAHGKYGTVAELWKRCQTLNVYPRNSALRKASIVLMKEKRFVEAEQMAAFVCERSQEHPRLFVERFNFLKSQTKRPHKLERNDS